MEIFELTLPQQDILNEQLIYNNVPIYNIGAKILIEGNINYDILNQAYQYLINSHDAYRIILNSDLNSYKIIEGHFSTLAFKDYSRLQNSEVIAEEFMERQFSQVFNLRGGILLFNFSLIKISEKKWYLFSVYHHLIVDGFGASLMFQRLVSIYNDLLETKELPIYENSYLYFVEDDRLYRESDTFKIDRDYWMAKFESLPNSFIPLIGEKKISSQRKKLSISVANYCKLNELAKLNKSTTFHLLIGIFFIVLKKYFQEDDLTIGIPVLNRSSAKFKQTVGLFMGANLLRINVKSSLSFSELVNQIRLILRSDYKHQRYPLGKLIRDLGCLKEVDRLFNVTFSYEKQDYSPNFLNTNTTVIPLTHNHERVALALYVREFDSTKDVVIDFDYNTSFLNNKTIEVIIDGFESVLKQVLDNPDTSIHDFNILSESYQKKIVQDFNKTKFDLSNQYTVISIFNGIVSRNTEKVAVSDGTLQLTYKQLDQTSNEIANSFYKTNKPSEQKPIGIVMDRSVNLISAILGSMKTGRGFIPIDPNFPRERIMYILAHADCSDILIDEHLVTNIFEDTYKYNLTTISPNISLSGSCLKYGKLKQEDTAYVIYTSGSTGQPKGVEITHRSLFNFLTSMLKEPGILDSDRVYSVTTCSFDIFYLEVFLPLFTGAELYIAKSNILSDPSLIINDIKTVRPSIIQSTPSFFQRMFDSGWDGDPNLKVLCGGDILNESIANLLVKNCKEVWNMYGPTETTIWSTIKKIRDVKDSTTIGKPINNTSIFILGNDNEILPIGVVGSLFISGEGLAKGYYRNKQLTDEKFQYFPTFNNRLYDTGDLAKWKENGEIELSGRKDFQVKIRGFRIEISEIENTISELNYVSQIAIVAREINNYKSLVAYYSGEKNKEIDIREYIQNKLPYYMVPDIIIYLDSLPLTNNTKIDRKELQKLPIVIESSNDGDQNYTDTQKKVKETFESTLKINGVKTDSDFFEVGGNSLNINILARELKNIFDINLPLSTIFQNSTVSKLSKLIDEELIISSVLKKNYNHQSIIDGIFFPLTHSQKSIWYDCQKPGKENCYNMNAWFEVKGDFDISKLERAFAKIIEQTDALNLNFFQKNGVVLQYFGNRSGFKLERLTSTEISTSVQNFFNKEFDLEQGRLIRAAVLYGNGKTYFLFSAHHLVMDGYSLDLLIKQLRNTLLPDSYRINIIDGSSYISYLENQLSLDQKFEGNVFWDEIFKGFRFTSIMETFKDGNSIENPKKEIKRRIAEEQFNRLKKLSIDWNISFNAFITFLIGVYINRITFCSDFMIGSTYHGRDTIDNDNCIGMFVNTIPLRVKLDINKSVNECVGQFNNTIHTSYKFHNYPIANKYYKQALPFEVLVSFQKANFLQNNVITFDEFSLLYIDDILYSSFRVPVLINLQEAELYLDIGILTSDRYTNNFTIFFIDSLISFLDDFIKNPYLPINNYNVYTRSQNTINNDLDFNF